MIILKSTKQSLNCQGCLGLPTNQRSSQFSHLKFSLKSNFEKAKTDPEQSSNTNASITNTSLTTPVDSKSNYATQEMPSSNLPAFRTAHEQWVIDNQKRFGRHINNRGDGPQHCFSGPISANSYGTNNTRSLGVHKSSNSFKPPIYNNQDQRENYGGSLCAQLSKKVLTNNPSTDGPPSDDDRLRGIDSKMVELIQNGKNGFSLTVIL